MVGGRSAQRMRTWISGSGVSIGGDGGGAKRDSHEISELQIEHRE